MDADTATAAALAVVEETEAEEEDNAVVAEDKVPDKSVSSQSVESDGLVGQTCVRLHSSQVSI